MENPRRGPRASDLQLAGEGGNSSAAASAADAIAVFAPWSGPTDRPLRLRLHRAQAAATARATRSRHGSARAIYWLAAQMASARIFARMDADELREAIDNMSRLFLVAGYIERTETPDER